MFVLVPRVLAALFSCLVLRPVDIDVHDLLSACLVGGPSSLRVCAQAVSECPVGLVIKCVDTMRLSPQMSTQCFSMQCMLNVNVMKSHFNM